MGKELHGFKWIVKLSAYWFWTIGYPMAKRPRSGDIFEIPLPNGFGYGQYLLKHTDPPCYGEFVRVFRGVRSARLNDWISLNNEPEQFLTFYSLGRAVRDGAVTLVGHVDVPARLKAFPQFKSVGRFDQMPHGRIHTWIFGSGMNVTVVQDSELSAEQRQMPIREIIGHGLLIQRLETGWAHSSSFVD